jgi:MoaA/NifB/PqqE/SkfB family radical SAM enzyme
VLTGGEVTIRNDFPLLVDHAVALGLHVSVQTNGRRLAEWERRIGLGNIHAAFIVAVHGPVQAIHDAITRKDGSFEETIEGLRLLLGYKDISVTGKIVISKKNCRVLVDTLRFLADLGVSQFNIAFPHAEEFSKEQFEAVVPQYHDIRDEAACCANFVAGTKLHATFETIPYCVTPECPALWNRSLDAVLITRSTENPGYIRATGDERLHEWEIERRQIKSKQSDCAMCLFDKACEGPWREYVDAYGVDEFRPLTNLEILNLLE